MTSEAQDMPTRRDKSPRIGVFARLIFGSRWLQLPLYVGLIVAQAIYVLLFLKELWHLTVDWYDVNEQQIMLTVLGLIDVVMISNLLVMVIALKSKLAMAIIGISSISLLRTFIEAGHLGSARTGYTETGVLWQVLIHITFILSAIGIAWVDRLSEPPHRKEPHQQAG